MKQGKINSKYIISNNNRFEGEYYLNTNSYLSMVLEQTPIEKMPLENYAYVFNPPVFKRQFCKKTNRSVQYFQSSDVPSSIETSEIYVYRPQAESLNLLVKKGDILVTGFGTIGNTKVVSSLQDGTCFANNVCRIRPNVKEQTGLLYSLLNSKYGYAQLNKNASGSVVRYIEAPGIKKTLIPNFSTAIQKEVDDLIKQSINYHEQATAKLDEAKRLFEYEIGRFTTNYAAYKNENINIQTIYGNFKRIDSQYQIGHKSIVKEKCNLVTTKINDIAKDIYIGNRGKRFYVERDGVYFLSSSDMMLANPKRFCKMISRKTPNLNDLLVKKGNILISRSGTVGNTILVGNDLDGCAVSEHAMRLVINEEKISPEYVFAYLCTKQGKDSLAILPYGSVIVTLGEEFLGDVDLPLLSNKTQDQITALVKEYSQMTDMAIDKENKAITMVEQEIEKWQSPTAKA